MRLLIPKFKSSFLSPVLLASLALMHCEPGKSLDVTVKNTPIDTSKVARIDIVAAPANVLPSDTATVQVSISDSATGQPLKRALLSISSTRFALLSAASVKVLQIDTVPDDGKVSFRAYSSAPGTGTITVKVTSGTLSRSAPITITVTEKPVAPKIKETLPQKLIPKDTAKVVFQILDSVQDKPLAKAVVTLSSAAFSICSPVKADTMTFDTTGADGTVSFRVVSTAAATATATAGTIQVKVKTAAGITRQATYTLQVAQEVGSDRPRKMVFTAARSTLRADGTDSTELRVLVKDDNNNPLSGEKITFTATGGVVKSEAITNAWGIAISALKSERVNKSIIVTATLTKTNATAQQTVAFDGVTINIAAQKRILMKDSLDPIVFELKDGGGVPMSGDSIEIVAAGAYKGFAKSDKDSMIVVTDTRGQYTTFITSQDARDITITARALGAKAVDTVTYTNNTLTLTSSKASVNGDGIDQATVTAKLKKGDGSDINGAELRWTTTFGTFTTSPFSNTAGGIGTIILKSARGSGLAIVNVEAYDKSGATRKLLASGNIIVPIKALKVSRLELKVTPDNIPVKIGETNLIATAFDSSNNVMTGVLVSFRLVRGAGGGDEVINPPVDYTKAGDAQATLKAGGVISLYRGVKLAAVALDISGTDTLVVASSDTVGLTVSGPPYKVSVGVNILKGINDNDGTFSLPSAAVVTDVNGNLVADGTPVNFSTTPVGGLYYGVSYHTISQWPYYVLGSDTVWFELPWTDYNNNKKLDPDEKPSVYDLSASHPARGEDRDGNGVINFPPDSYVDINHNGRYDATNAEPLVPVPVGDTSKIPPFVDFNLNGIRDLAEPILHDENKDGICQCTGTRDASGNLYEETYFGSTANHPFPGEVSVGVTRQVGTVGGKALTKIVYVQSMARRVDIRLTAESNGIRAYVDAILPIIKDN